MKDDVIESALKQMQFKEQQKKKKKQMMRFIEKNY